MSEHTTPEPQLSDLPAGETTPTDDQVTGGFDPQPDPPRVDPLAAPIYPGLLLPAVQKVRAV